MSDTIYEMVTERVLAELERGTAPWHQPWNALPLSLSTGKPYRGINIFLLGIAAAANGFKSRHWGTYRQIAALGGQVRKGEHGHIVIFWKRGLRKPRGDEDPDQKVPTFILRYYTVFSADQADGLPEKFTVNDADDAPQRADDIMSAYLARAGGPSLRHGGNDACYAPKSDQITLPPKGAFETPDAYHGTAFHEMTHSTGHASRLNRDGTATFDHFGSARYGKEELVAEMGAAMLLATAGITSRAPENAAYVAAWLEIIRADARLVVQAAAQAQHAADFILGTDPGGEDEVR